MNKRGVGHIEVVFAFLLFMTFIFTAVYFLNPTKTPTQDNTLVRHTLDSISQQANTNVIKYSVIFDNSVSENIVAVNLSETNISYNVAAEDYYGNKLEVNRDANPEIIYVRPNSNFSAMKFSPDIIKNYTLFGTTNLEDGQYTVASVIVEQMLSEKKILELSNLYYSNYEEAGIRLGMPRDRDFSFVFVFDDDNKIEAIKTIPKAASVYSYERSVKVLSNDGSIKFADVIVKIW